VSGPAAAERGLARRRVSRPTRSKVLAALVGTLAPSILAAAALGRFAPASEPARFALGYALALPIWIAAMCLVALAPTGRRAWLLCALATAVAGALALAIPH
jgi:hypothetical protein